MANIFLDANDSFTQSSTNTNDSIFGRSGGTENVILQGNPTGTRLDGNIEVVQVAGTAAGTTLQVNATTGQLELVSGGVVFATFTGGLNQAVSLRFTDGDVTLSQTGANAFTIANPANAANNVTINPTTPQAGGAVTLGSQTSTAGTTTGDGTTTPVGAQTFSLTAGVDNLSGTTNSDTFNGLVDGTTVANTTFSAADVLNGGTGTDTINVTAQGGAVTLGGAAVSNIEVFNVRAVGTGAVTADASLYAGVSTFASDRSTQNVNVDNLATGAIVKAIGNGTVVNGGVDFSYATLTDAVSVTFDGGTKQGTVRNIDTAGGGTTNATAALIKSTGASNTFTSLDLTATSNSITGIVTIDAATNLKGALVAADFATAGATLIVTGAGAVDVGNNGIFKTIDATGNTGGVTIDVDSVTTSAKFGSGADVITTGATTATTAGLVDGGSGTDTLVVGTNVAHVDTASEAAEYVNFETLSLNGTLDVSLLSGITAIELGGATNNISKLTATQAGSVTAKADIGDTTIALATSSGTSDVLSLTMGDGKGAAFNAGALTINGFETLNVNANPLATNADKETVIASFTADRLAAINLTGNSVDLQNAATTRAVTIDGSALTGTLKVAGNLVAGSTVNASAGKDVLTLGTAGSTYNGGANDDTFVATAVAQLESSSVFNTINGGAGIDTVQLTADNVTLVDSNFSQMSNIEKITVVASGGTAAGESLTTGGFFNTAFAASGAEITYTSGAEVTAIDAATFTGAMTLALTTAATTQNTTVVTGSGADKVTVAANAATTGNIVVTTNDGNDIIIVDVSADVAVGAESEITGGKGADTITFIDVDAADAIYFDVNIGAGDSTTASYDKINGWVDGDSASSVLLDFAGSAAAGANATAQGVTGFTSAQLTYGVSSGVLTFAGSSAADLTLAQKISAVDSVISTNLATVAFEHSGSTFVYNENSGGDSLVELVGITGITAIGAGVTADNGINIG